ncbi:MAG: GNAT family N-acetyltransferase [Spirochaetaceae bacterium]|nr:GNAT family N-acetyltransferase [Spirochaetaceae bacterium]
MVRVRQAEEADLAALAALSGELGYPSALPEVAARFRRLRAGEWHLLLVAALDAEVVGYLTADRYETLYFAPGLNITALVVREERRGQGIGTALLSAAEDWARAAGLEFVRLNSGGQRLDAHAFYRRRGYGDEKEQKRFFKEL